MSWKYCFVLSCLNNSKKNPDKLYFRVPYNQKLRENWCIAVDRSVASLKRSSTAYCCSDHFNIDEDLDRLKSTSEKPKLKDGVKPSIKHRNSTSHGKETMDVIEDIFGADVLSDEKVSSVQPSASGRYIREVVYIEENDNDQFLQENVEEIDSLNVAPADEQQNLTAKAVVEISDDEDLLTAVASAIKSLKPTESLSELKNPRKKKTKKTQPDLLVDQKVVAAKPQVQSNEVKKVVAKKRITDQSKVVALKSQVERINLTESKKLLLKVQDKMVPQIKCKVFPEVNTVLSNAKSAIQQGSSAAATTTHNMPLQYQTNFIKKIAKSPRNMILTPQFQVKQNIVRHTPTTQSIVATKQIQQYTFGNQPIANLTTKPLVTLGNQNTKSINQGIVNRLKYTNVKDYSTLKNQQHKPIKRHEPAADDDCIFVDEPSPKLTFSNCSANVVKNVSSPSSHMNSNESNDKLITKLPACISVRTSGVNENSKFQHLRLVNSTTVSPIVRVAPMVKVHEFGHNSIPTTQITKSVTDKEIQLLQLILMENPTICHSITNTAKRQRITITRSRKNEFRIADSIYYYRSNDIFPKNYFFMNITRNLCQSDETVQRNYGIYWGSPRVSCVGIVETRGILDDETKDFVFQQVKQSLLDKGGQRIKIVNITQQAPTNPPILPSSNIPTIIKPSILKSIDSLHPSNTDLDIINLDDDSIEIPEEPNANSLTNFISIINVPNISPTDGSLTSQNKILANPIVQQSSAKFVDTKVGKELQVQQSEQGIKTDLSTLYKRLVPATRKLINELKYFEMKDGSVHTVTIGPNYSSDNSKDNPFNIIFVKHKPETAVKAISKRLPIARLVNDIFEAIHPILNSKPLENNDKPTLTSKQKRSPPKKIPIINVVQPKADNNVHPAEPLKPIASNTSPKKGLIKINDQLKSGKQLIKYKCSICAQNFDRSYKLKRHQFVQHCGQSFDQSYKLQRHQFVQNLLDKDNGNSVPIDAVSNLTTESVAESMKANVLWHNIPVLQEPFKSGLETVPVIEKEKLDDTISEDKTLLIPLFEVPIDERSKAFKDVSVDFSSVQCKQEPEENIEDNIVEYTEDVVAMPVSAPNYSGQPKELGNYSQLLKSPDHSSTEETDSATEKPLYPMNKFKIKLTPLPKKRLKRVKKVRRDTKKQDTKKKYTKKQYTKKQDTAAKRKKRQRRNINRLIKCTKKLKIRKSSSAVPIKISKIKQFMKNWPTLTVNLVDICKHKH